MIKRDPWEPSAPILIGIWLALLSSLGIALAITVRSVQFFTLKSILPTLFILLAWPPLIASAVALRAIMLNRRQPRPEYRRRFKVAINWWFFLMLLAIYTGLGTLDVFGQNFTPTP